MCESSYCVMIHINIFWTNGASSRLWHVGRGGGRCGMELPPPLSVYHSSYERNESFATRFVNSVCHETYSASQVESFSLSLNSFLH